MALSLRAKFFKAFLRSRQKAGVKNIGNPQRQRKEMDAAMALLVKPLGLHYQQRDIAGVRTIVATPKKSTATTQATNKALLYWHGGGYVIGKPESFKSLYGQLGKRIGATVYAPDYRLAPEYPYPAAIDDAIACYQALLNQYGAENIAVAGDSAGANLCLAMCLKARDMQLPQPAALYLLSPFADLQLNAPSTEEMDGKDPVLDKATLVDWASKYAQREALSHPMVSVTEADYRGLPPMLIQVGSDEVLRDDSYAVRELAEQAGIEVQLELGEGLWHDWQLFAPLMPEASAAIDRAASWLNSKY